MTSISSSCSSSSSSFSSSNNSKNNKSVSPLTNFINENYSQQQFSEIKFEQNRKTSTTENQQNSSQITQQQIQLLEMLAKAGLIPSNSLPNKQEDGDEQQKESGGNNEGCGDLFDSNSLFDNVRIFTILEIDYCRTSLL
ncbi:unnamed protein product [Meloidogyne enterolobii]|uniref:Uncharacterized protein n=1 Tax=Meloidogyne enterolobii TaxID=390850 RepID=A0ACB1AMP9_MELEN